ncbi:MAG: hypothetical protein P1V51_14480 [Deltaproteobacteria bacterium]|nr:hypothetical protein [Deltaproteobacteria bacterium]
MTQSSNLDLGLASVPTAAPTAVAAQAPEAVAVDESSPWWLIAPYGVNSKVALSEIRHLQHSQSGAVFAFLVASNGKPYRIDICRHDASIDAPAPIARTAGYDLFIANEGEGQAPTDREQGLAVLALADAIRSAELGGKRLSLLTMRERWTRFSKVELGPSLA